MKRKLFTLCAAFSLLLCVAVCALWMRSYLRQDVLLYYADGETTCLAASNRGVFVVGRETGSRSPVPAQRWEYATDDPEPSWLSQFSLRLGFGIHRPGNAVLIFFPHAALAAPSALLAALCWAYQRRLRRRACVGLCPTCGYDLRATPDRCPECGAAGPT